MPNSNILINTKLPTIRQLQCFLAVCQELNFRKAAEHLNMTQPPLTRQIQTLEYVLGQKLFFRNTHEVVLTTAGQNFFSRVEFLIEELFNIVQEIAISTIIRIGCTNCLNFENIPSIFDKLCHLGSQIELISESFSSKQLLSYLEKGKLDIIFTGEKVISDISLRCFKVYKEPLVLVIPVSHAASKKKTVSLKDVADLSLYWFPRNDNIAYYDKCEDYFRRLPFQIEKIKEPKQSFMLFDKISKGRGMALIPRSICNIQSKNCCWKELDTIDSRNLNIDIYMIIRSNEKNEAILNVVNYLMRPSQILCNCDLD